MATPSGQAKLATNHWKGTDVIRIYGYGTTVVVAGDRILFTHEFDLIAGVHLAFGDGTLLFIDGSHNEGIPVNIEMISQGHAFITREIKDGKHTIFLGETIKWVLIGESLFRNEYATP